MVQGWEFKTTFPRCYGPGLGVQNDFPRSLGFGVHGSRDLSETGHLSQTPSSVLRRQLPDIQSVPSPHHITRPYSNRPQNPDRNPRLEPAPESFGVRGEQGRHHDGARGPDVGNYECLVPNRLCKVPWVAYLKDEGVRVEDEDED
jgi:hypothetical protein